HRSPRGRESPAPGGSGAGLSENPAIREWPGLTHLLLKRQLRAISATTGGATAAAATAATTAGGRLRHGQRQAVGLQVAGTGGDVDADVARGAVEGRPVQGGAVGRRDRDLVAQVHGPGQGGIQLHVGEVDGARLVGIEGDAADLADLVGLAVRVVDRTLHVAVHVDVAQARRTDVVAVVAVGTPQLGIDVAHLVRGAPALVTGCRAVRTGHGAAEREGDGVGDVFHAARVGGEVARRHLVGRDRRLCVRAGGDRGRERVALCVVVARGDVDVDVARSAAEGRAAEVGIVRHAGVVGGVGGADLAVEDLGVGHAEGEAGVRRRQRRGIVLGVVVTGGDVEAQVARGPATRVIGDAGGVVEDVVVAVVLGDGLAPVHDRDGGRVEVDVAGDGRLAGERDVGAHRQVLGQVDRAAVLVLLAADLRVDVDVLGGGHVPGAAVGVGLGGVGGTGAGVGVRLGGVDVTGVVVRLGRGPGVRPVVGELVELAVVADHRRRIEDQVHVGVNGRIHVHVLVVVAILDVGLVIARVVDGDVPVLAVDQRVGRRVRRCVGNRVGGVEVADVIDRDVPVLDNDVVVLDVGARVLVIHALCECGRARRQRGHRDCDRSSLQVDFHDSLSLVGTT